MATPRRPACLKIQTLALDVPILAGTARATSTDSSKGKPRLTISVEAAAVRIQGCSVGCRISRPTIALGQVGFDAHPGSLLHDQQIAHR